MKCMQLGNAGKFDYETTNSSFIVDIGDNVNKMYLLIDCGRNIFDKLIKLDKDVSNIIRNIEYVFITGLGDHKMGSLETLLRYRQFELGKETKVFSGDEGVGTYLNNGDMSYANPFRISSDYIFFRYLGARSIVKLTNDIELKLITTNRVLDNTHGVVVSKIKSETANHNKHLIITGDTKPSEIIEYQISKDLNTVELDNVNWLDVDKSPDYKYSNNCKIYHYHDNRDNDILSDDRYNIYSEVFKHIINAYGDNTVFDNKWVVI